MFLSILLRLRGCACLHIAINNRLRLLPLPILYFFNFWGAFVSPKTVKNNIAGMMINLKSVMRWKSQLEEVLLFKLSGNKVIDGFPYFSYFKALIHSRHFKFSGMGVIRGLTRPLPVPGPLGVPGPYQVFPGTRLKTEIKAWKNKSLVKSCC